MLSETIYTLRRKAGLSQEQLAEKVGVSRQAISKWEGGLSVPELDKLQALGKVFGVTLDQLVNGDASPQSAPSQPAPPPRKESRSGLALCIAGAVCLIFTGIMTVAGPAASDRISQSSVITLDGTGILAVLSVLAMAAGFLLILRKK